MWRNLLEPQAYADLYAAHPPLGFAIPPQVAGLPLFEAPFDLLTTLDRPLYRRLRGLPGFAWWTRALRWRTLFAGTTITEYAPLPRGLSPDALMDALGEAAAAGPLLTVLKDLPCRSPLLPEEDNTFADAVAEAAAQAGWLELAGQALAYVPVDTPSTEAYLARLSPARRKDLRRKLKARARLEVEALPLGDPRLDEALVGSLYVMYEAVFAQSETPFDRLSPDFFRAFLQHREINGLVVLYHRDGELIGHNICLIHNGALVDKYVGFAYPQARENHLYFLSWLENLELARERGLHTYIAGWTDPEVKAALGARFTFTRHLVRVKNPVARAILTPMRGLFEADAGVVPIGRHS